MKNGIRHQWIWDNEDIYVLHMICFYIDLFPLVVYGFPAEGHLHSPILAHRVQSCVDRASTTATGPGLLGTGPGLPARHRATSSGLDTSRPGVVVFITVRGRWVDMGTWRYLWPLCAVAYQWKTIDGLTTTRDIYIPIVTEFTLIDTNSLHKQNKIELSVLIYFISLNSQHIKSSKHISDAYISIYSCVTWW